MRTKLLAALLLPVSAGCGPYVFATVEDRQICLTTPGQSVPAAPPGIGAQSVSWKGEIDVGSAITELQSQGSVSGTIELLSLALDSTTSLDGITHASVTLGRPDPRNPANTISVLSLAYDQPPQPPDPNEIAFTIGQPPPNLLDALVANSGKLQIDTSFTGALPSEPWTVDVIACLSVAVTVDFLK